MSLSIYHGDEDWILRGFGIDIEKSINSLYPNFTCKRIESFEKYIGDTEYHLFVQQGQLRKFVSKKGSSRLSKTICIFTHFDHKQFPVDILNQCMAILFMSSSQLSVAVANGLNSSHCFVVPLGVDQSLHKIIDEQQILKIQSSQKIFSHINGRDAIGFCLRYWDKPTYTLRKRYKLIMRVVQLLSNEFDLPVIILGPGWKNCEYRIENKNVLYAKTEYKNYPIFYNMMKIFCSLSLHEGGPMPLLESMSCGVCPVVTNTGFTFDVLRNQGLDPFSSMSVDAPFVTIISSIINAYNSPINPGKYREIAAPFTFDNAARKIMRILNSQKI